LLLFERLISTTERRESLLFVGDWGEHPEGGVAALAVVERLDVFEHGGLEFEPRGPAAAVDELLLQRGEERLGDGVRVRFRLRLMALLGSELFV
jgi:hypothetical protein